MTQAAESAATPQMPPSPSTTTPETSASTLLRRPQAGLSAADRRAARQLLGAIVISVGIAHLTHQRFYRSLLPYWLSEARREIDVATGTVEVFGGTLLFMPRLRQAARWTNLALLAPPLLGALGETRHRPRPHMRERVGLNPLGPLALAPGHLGLAGALWWATHEKQVR